MLTTLGVIPLIGAFLVSVTGPAGKTLARPIGLLAALATLGVALASLASFDPSSAKIQFAETYSWIPALGVSYALGVNGIGYVMILLSTVLVPVCMVALWNVADGKDGVDGARVRNFVALTLVLETMMIGVFAARDVFLFYVFFEAMLVPAFFMISGFGNPGARKAAVRFLLYGLAGGLIMLVAVIGLYLQGPGGEQGFLIDSLTGLEYSSASLERWLFLGFFLAFAIKAPMWPLHTWLPLAAEKAPPGVSVLVVGVLDKVGTFGMMTLCLVLFPDASTWAAPAVIMLALASLIAGGLGAIGSTDIQRLIAYTSISHFGLIVMGIFAMTQTGQSGAMLYMVNHGFSTAALFLVAGMLVARRGSQQIADFGGYQRVVPWLAGSFLIAGLSSLALPGLSSFVSEFLVIVGTFERYTWAAVVGCAGLVLSAMYILITYKRMMTGPTPENTGWRDMSWREAVIVAPLMAVIIGFGFYPQPLLDLVNPAVQHTMTQLGVADPAPLAEGGTH